MKRIIFLFSILFILSCADEGLVNIKNNTDNGSYNPNNPNNPHEPSKPIIPDVPDGGSQNPDKPQDIIPATPLEPAISIYDYDVTVSTVSHISRDTDISKWGFLPCDKTDSRDNVLADKLGRPTSTSIASMYVSGNVYYSDIDIKISESNHICDSISSSSILIISISSNKSFEIHDRELIWETMAEYIKKDPYTNKDNKKETITIKSSVGK